MMVITKAKDITEDNVDWVTLGTRFTHIRISRNLTRLDACKELKIGSSCLTQFEQGVTRKSTNIIWNVSAKWDLSVNWLLNGLGKPYDLDPVNLMPETLYVQKGAGIKRSAERVQAEEGQFSDEVLEFVIAIDKFKTKNQVTFPSLTQIYEIITALGYRKAVPARIAPLGYVIELQKHAEKLQQENERMERVDLQWDSAFYSEAKRKLLENKTPLPPKEPPNFLKPKKAESHKDYTKTQKYIVANELGETRTIYNVAKFCRIHKLNERSMLRVVHEKQLDHQGWHVPTEKNKKALKERSEPKYFLTDNQGKEHAVHNLAQFCKDHNLDRGAIVRVVGGKRIQHKGWYATIQTEKIKKAIEEKFAAPKRAKKRKKSAKPRKVATRKKSKNKSGITFRRQSESKRSKILVKLSRCEKYVITGNPVLDRMRQGLIKNG